MAFVQWHGSAVSPPLPYACPHFPPPEDVALCPAQQHKVAGCLCKHGHVPPSVLALKLCMAHQALLLPPAVSFLADFWEVNLQNAPDTPRHAGERENLNYPLKPMDTMRSVNWVIC